MEFISQIVFYLFIFSFCFGTISRQFSWQQWYCFCLSCGFCNYYLSLYSLSQLFSYKCSSSCIQPLTYIFFLQYFSQNSFPKHKSMYFMRILAMNFEQKNNRMYQKFLSFQPTSTLPGVVSHTRVGDLDPTPITRICFFYSAPCIPGIRGPGVPGAVQGDCGQPACQSWKASTYGISFSLTIVLQPPDE